jgi:tetratricopeptide (TPR) repeat protein
MSTHLVKHQKITKRQMKEDPLVTAAFKATAFWERHGTRILIAAGVAGLLALLAFFMAQARSKSEEKASGELFRASLAVNQGDYGSAIPMLKELIDNEPGTQAARDAMLYLGDSYASSGKPSDAATTYRKFIDKSHGNREKQRIGYFALGTALEDGREFLRAADAYAQSVERSTTDNQRGRAMMGQARSLLKAGQTAKAIELYRAITLLPEAELPITEAAKERIGEVQASQTGP